MYEKQTLPNGVRIVYEHMPHVRSAAIGVWIGVGSRYESPSNAGSAHFIEHMLFKGTAQHTASELAERMDAIGGQVNAANPSVKKETFLTATNAGADCSAPAWGYAIFASAEDPVQSSTSHVPAVTESFGTSWNVPFLS